MIVTSASAAKAPRKAQYRYGYARSPDLDARVAVRHPVVVVGAGPVGLTVSLDLAYRGVGVLLLDDADRIGEGSRHLLGQTHAGDLGPAGSRGAHGRKGSDLEARQSL